MNKPLITSSGSKKYHQGYYKPVNPNKYIGNSNNIMFRSSWEKMFLIYCDTNPNIVKYSSEEISIPYLSSIDGKEHKYFIDFIIFAKQHDGSIKKFLIEIKPFKQTIVPVQRKGKTQARFMTEMQEYIKNQDKWKYAKEYAEKHDSSFLVLTEKDLFIKKN